MSISSATCSSNHERIPSGVFKSPFGLSSVGVCESKVATIGTLPTFARCSNKGLRSVPSKKRAFKALRCILPLVVS
ncbi:hypothetical protein Plhal304r1_c014g0052881 [Plasmopara halstedii]